MENMKRIWLLVDSQIDSMFFLDIHGKTVRKWLKFYMIIFKEKFN
jgi:hypothetical protein